MKIEREDLIGKEFQGRKASRVIEIPAAGTFRAFYEAIGFALGYDYVAKWYNIDHGDRSRLDGLLLHDGGFREGGVKVIFFNQPHLGE